MESSEEAPSRSLSARSKGNPGKSNTRTAGGDEKCGCFMCSVGRAELEPSWE